jgi:hypothetical protein
MLALLALLALCFARSDALSHAMLTWRLFRFRQAKQTLYGAGEAAQEKAAAARDTAAGAAQGTAEHAGGILEAVRPSPALACALRKRPRMPLTRHAPLRSALCAGQGEARGVFNWTKSNALNLTR